MGSVCRDEQEGTTGGLKSACAGNSRHEGPKDGWTEERQQGQAVEQAPMVDGTSGTYGGWWKITRVSGLRRVYRFSLPEDKSSICHGNRCGLTTELPYPAHSSSISP